MPPLSLLVQAVAPDLTADVPGRVGTPKRQGVRLTPPTGHVIGRVLRDAQQAHGVGRPVHAGRTPATGFPYATLNDALSAGGPVLPHWHCWQRPGDGAPEWWPVGL